jgi:Tfp pilus assembly protein PilX
MRTFRERGAALITVLLMMTFLGAVGGALLMSVTMDAWISLNYRDAARLIYLAEAGVEEGRERLRTSRMSPSTLLDAAAGSDGVLALSLDLDTLLESDDAPIIEGGDAAGRYRVFLRNDAVDGPANTVDTNGVLTLVSIASKGALRKTLEVTVLRQRLPRFHAALMLDGSPVLFAPANSVGSVISGFDASGTGDHGHAVGVITAADKDVVLLAIPPGAEAQFPGTSSVVPPPPDIAVLETLPAGLKRMTRDIEAVATDVLTPAPGTPAILDHVGSAEAPRVVVVNGDCALGSGDGFGILLVRGVLTLSGNFRWTGVILVVGQGEVRSTGGGGQISGGLLLARESGAVVLDLQAASGLRVEINRQIENALTDFLPYAPIAIREGNSYEF